MTVIIPTHNRAALLAEALQSIATQTFRDFEVIVIDDGSDDEEVRLAAASFVGVRYFRLPTNSGRPAVARNAGLKLAEGHYVAFLDSDDRWLPMKLAHQMSIMESDPAVGLACSNAIVVDGDGTRSRPFMSRGSTTGHVLPQLIQENFVITSTVIAQRHLILELGGFCEEGALRALEDYDLWLRLAARTSVYYTPTCLAEYREHSASIRHSGSASGYWRGLLLIARRLRHDVSTMPASTSTLAALREIELRYRLSLCSAYWSERSARCVLVGLEMACRYPEWVWGWAIVLLRAVKLKISLVARHGSILAPVARSTVRRATRDRLGRLTRREKTRE